MAEVLGVVAGSAGLAQLASQLIGSCIKVRRLYTSFKEAPVFLVDTLEDMESMARFLRQLERDYQRRNRDRVSDGMVEEYVGRCHRATTRVQGVVDELEVVMEKSSIRGRMFTAFSQERIRNLCNELEKAKTSLLLALDLYKLSCQTQDTSRIIDTLDQNNAVLIQQFKSVAAEMAPTPRPYSPISQDEPGKRSKDESTHQLSRRRQHNTKPSHQQQHWRIRLQPWFTRQVWEISLSAAQSGFNISLRTCNFVPHKSLIFDACHRGDLAEVQVLFRSRQATPFDCSSDYFPYQKTVLSEAARSGNTQLCRYLIDLAGYPVRPNGSQDPIMAYSMYLLPYTQVPETQEMYRILLQDPSQTPVGLEGGISRSIWWAACPNPVITRMVLDEFPELFSATSWKTRVSFAFNAYRFQDDMPDIILAMLGFHRVNAQVAQARDDDGHTCLHKVAWRAASTGETTPAIVCFVRQLLACGADIHETTNAGDTPLMIFLQTQQSGIEATSIRVWIQLLEAAGIDLKDYGQTEFAHWSALPVDDTGDKNIRITKFKFGPRVEDWVIDRLWKVDIPIYELASAPGTWPDEATHMTRIICWHPQTHREDDPKRPCHWKMVRQVTVWFRQIPSEESWLDGPVIRRLRRELEKGTQDDCASVTRLLTSGRRPLYRPRSYSQPASGPSLACGLLASISHSWLPPLHICINGRPTLDFPLSIRSCAKGIHDHYVPDPDETYHNAIEREMRHFQTRYNGPEDLPSLPYAAYHPVWKGNRRLEGSGVVEEL